MEINLNDITIYTSTNRAIIYLFKFNNKNTRKWCDLCSSSTKKNTSCFYCQLSGVFIVNFEHISDFFLVLLLLILKK